MRDVPSRLWRGLRENHAMDKTSIFRRPDGRLRAAFVVPALFAAFLLAALIWQSMHTS
jgi:hypothetical protein